MFEKELLPVVWLCKSLSKKFNKRYFVRINEKTVFNGDCGILCDCGHWTFGDDNFHKPIKKDYREVYYNDTV